MPQRRPTAANGATPPVLLMHDEPTNHLDIPAPEAVGTGLATWRGAVLVASHDTAFLDRLGLARQIPLLPAR